MQTNKKAVILFSGGMDSTTCLVMAKQQGYICYALSFDYGQRHRIELAVAKQLAQLYGAVEHRTVVLGIGDLGGSALTDVKIDVPSYRGDNKIPVTYVPARNTVFLAVALAWAEILGAQDIFIGVNAIDYSGYPDCRPEFIAAFERVASLATKAGVEGTSLRIHTPLLRWDKAEIIRQGLQLGIDYGLTLSCYQPNDQGHACGVCDSCHLRKKGFNDAGIPDPTRYQLFPLMY